MARFIELTSATDGETKMQVNWEAIMVILPDTTNEKYTRIVMLSDLVYLVMETADEIKALIEKACTTIRVRQRDVVSGGAPMRVELKPMLPAEELIVKYRVAYVPEGADQSIDFSVVDEEKMAFDLMDDGRKTHGGAQWRVTAESAGGSPIWSFDDRNKLIEKRRAEGRLG